MHRKKTIILKILIIILIKKKKIFEMDIKNETEVTDVPMEDPFKETAKPAPENKIELNSMLNIKPNSSRFRII